ncbi:hypothetical protein JXVLWARM_CDS_0021 [Burkholderia phage Bm1]
MAIKMMTINSEKQVDARSLTVVEQTPVPIEATRPDLPKPLPLPPENIAPSAYGKPSAEPAEKE